MQSGFYNPTAATKTLLICLSCVRPSRSRTSTESRQQLEKIIADIGTAVEDVMRITRQNFENDAYFRRWCLEKDEDWSSVASEFSLLVEALGISPRTAKYIKVAWYDGFNKLHADVQKKK